MELFNTRIRTTTLVFTMKCVASCAVIWHLHRFWCGSHAKRPISYYACKFQDDKVQPLIASGIQFYNYLQNDPRLWKEYSLHMDPEDKDHSKNYLNRNYADGKEELHTTMFFGLTPEAREAYAERQDVKKAQGHEFNLEIHGVIITKSTLGFRVKLPEEALPLWDFKDNTPSIDPPVCEDIKKFGNLELQHGGPVFSPGNFTRGSRAHATVLTSSVAQAVQTGLDIVDIMYCEEKCVNNPFYREVKLSNGWDAKMRYYGHGRFVFYLNTKHYVPAKFLRLETGH